MDIKNLFTIGEMGGLFRTNIRTLRYYDDIGLLKPEVVDPKTGYRYYSARQFERMNTIKYLRNLNMPLDKIKAFFENRDTLVMEQILEERRKKLQPREPKYKKGVLKIYSEHAVSPMRGGYME